MPRAAPERSGNPAVRPRNRATFPSVHPNGRGRDGIPFRRKDRLPKYLAAFTAAFERFEDLRRPGAACLDLAWAACGVFDGFFELGLGPWDVAAGGLLVEEAGGRVTDWDGGARYLAGDILAGSPAVHDELRRIAGGHGTA